MAERPVAVTPAGIRAGDRATSEALCARRGAAVLAYCEHVAAPGEAVAAAAEGFARFRATVIDTPDSDGVDPDVLLLSATRHAAARHAPRPGLARIARQIGAGGRRAQACALVPELLAARAEGALSDADRLRLSRHLQGCHSCEAAQRRFSAAEAAYRNPPERPPDARAGAEIVRALTGGAGGAYEHASDPESVEDAGRRLTALLAGADAAGGAPPAQGATTEAVEDPHAPAPAPGDGEPPRPRASVEPPGADPGPDWPDDSQIITVARITKPAAPSPAPSAAHDQEAAASGGPGTVSPGHEHADVAGAQPAGAADLVALGATASLASLAPGETDLRSGEQNACDLDEEWARDQRPRLPPPPPRRDRAGGRFSRADHGAPQPGLEEASPELGLGAAAVHPLSTSRRRQPLWVLILPVLVVIAALLAALSLAGVLQHSASHTTAPRAPTTATPAAPGAAAAPAAPARHHRHHHRAHAATASGSATALTTPEPAPLPPSGRSTGTSRVVPSSGSGDSSPIAPAPASSHPVSTPAPATTHQPAASSAPAASGAPATGTPPATGSAPATGTPPAASTEPATSLQSDGSSSAAAPAGGGTPTSDAPSTYQASGG